MIHSLGLGSNNVKSDNSSWELHAAHDPPPFPTPAPCLALLKQQLTDLIRQPKNEAEAYVLTGLLYYSVVVREAESRGGLPGWT